MKKPTTDYKITGSLDAMRRSLKLPAIWSHESLLTQRILIRILEVLKKRGKTSTKKQGKGKVK